MLRLSKGQRHPTSEVSLLPWGPLVPDQPHQTLSLSLSSACAASLFSFLLEEAMAVLPLVIIETVGTVKLGLMDSDQSPQPGHNPSWFLKLRALLFSISSLSNSLFLTIHSVTPN